MDFGSTLLGKLLNVMFQHMHDAYGFAAAPVDVRDQQMGNITLPVRPPVEQLQREGSLGLWLRQELEAQIASHWQTVAQGGDNPASPTVLLLHDGNGALTGEKLILRQPSSMA